MIKLFFLALLTFGLWLLYDIWKWFIKADPMSTGDYDEDFK